MSKNLTSRTIAVAGATALATILAVSPAVATIIETGTVTPSVASAGNTSIPGTLTIGPGGTIGSVEVNNNSQLTTGTGNAGVASTIVGEGAGSNGTLTINTGSDVISSTFAVIGNAGGTGTVHVDGNGSTFAITGPVFLGPQNGGDGTLNVSAGGEVTTTGTLVLGQDSGGVGNLNIDGTGSSVTSTDIPLVSNSIGRAGNANVRISGEGLLSIASGFTGIGQEITSTAEITVTGMNSSFANANGDMAVAIRGSGTLNVGDDPDTGAAESGGKVDTARISVASFGAGTGTVTAKGAGAQLNMTGTTSNNDNGAQLSIGLRGTGTVNILDGATAVVDAQGMPTGLSGGLFMGGSNAANSAGDGTLNIDGIGSSLEVRTGFAQIARNGTAEVNITDGGSLDTSGASTNVVARKPDSTGTVNITGAGSIWNTGDDLFIGTDVSINNSTVTGPGGSGTVNVANGGSLVSQMVVNAAGGTLAGGGGSITGTVNNQGGAIAAGNSTGLMTVFGNLNLMSGGTVQIELGGTVFDSGIPQFDYDRILIADDATTGATEGMVTIDPGAIFDVSYFDAFTASLGDTFDVIVADSIMGDLALSSFLMPMLTGSLSWDMQIVSLTSGQDALRLAVLGPAAVPEPGTAPLLISGLLAIPFLRRRERQN